MGLHTRRHGQAALEFITTYGWAILIIMVMVGAFAYFGILNPSKLMPERCAGTPEFVCSDHQILSGSPTAIKMVFKQTVGKTIYLTNATCAYNNAAPKQATSLGIDNETSVYTLGSSWSPRSKIFVTCSDAAIPTALKGEKIKVNYALEYKMSSTGLLQTTEGELIAEVQ